MSVSAFADEVGCPKTHAGAPLVTVTLFDGPPSEHADLMPDTVHESNSGSKSEWDVAYIFEAGRRLFVECQYGPKITPVIIEPSPSTSKCEFLSQGVGKKSLVCRSRPA
jgi:hypothetical protein